MAFMPWKTYSSVFAASIVFAVNREDFFFFKKSA